MMFAGLADGDDFRDRVHELGVDIPAGATPEVCASLALAPHQGQPVKGSRALALDLIAHADAVLPEVRDALELVLQATPQTD